MEIEDVVNKYEDGIFSGEICQKISEEISKIIGTCEGDTWHVVYNPDYNKELYAGVLFVFNAGNSGRSISWKRYYSLRYYDTDNDSNWYRSLLQAIRLRWLSRM